MEFDPGNKLLEGELKFLKIRFFFFRNLLLFLKKIIQQKMFKTEFFIKLVFLK